MVKREVIMAVANRPLKHRRRTAQRGKPMSQSQRWGKVTVTTMPIPGGEITSTETWGLVPPTEEVVPDLVPVTDEAILAADAEEAVEEYLPDEVVEE
jgi:hypothetical protein